MNKLIGLVFLSGCSLSVFGKTAEAIFAGGCFWFMEADFYKQKGVLATITGFDGGTTPDPTYEEVTAGHTNYTEAVRIIYNPAQISYKQLLDYFWHHIDPTTEDAQFCESGRQYRAAIFYLNENQKRIALESKKSIEKKFPKIYTEILPSTTFYAADDDHQNYSQKNPLRYRYYRFRCGRDSRLEAIWGKP
ncbi:peptide methionine sulfoxide reductase [Legionella birminghamensis]|uniref:Peptide methionine sulfoxide reductase MsrA n=1 Tax=Legionella birminghamensis TaxID=28083 RepID=A0A378I6Q3_9GAMM|nr:peptide-methionine (S)-S-oxide reductase MsrA [Legionella birminghamensis]KTC73930.1 peptide methionine sulfoxide reductase [Legionella birminghamensis]STX30426.1 peptide methionine sulfoxide reductase [Legionella birminghamensis]